MKDKKLHPKLTLVIIVTIVVLTGVTAWILSNKLRNDDTKQTSTTQTEQKTESQPNTLSYDGVEGKNALELLKSKAAVVTKQSAYGEYVDAINGIVGGTDGKYWAFYVNGTMAQVGAADYKTKNGDKVTWKFE